MIQIDVSPEVVAAWRGMARDLDMPLSDFIRCCVRTAGPRLLRTYSDITRSPSLYARAQSYTRTLREDQP